MESFIHDGLFLLTWRAMVSSFRTFKWDFSEEIEDIYFSEVITKYTSSSMLKILMFSTHEMKYYWYLPKKYFFILFLMFTMRKQRRRSAAQ